MTKKTFNAQLRKRSRAGDPTPSLKHGQTTPNAEGGTSNIEFNNGLIAETPNENYGASKKPLYDLEDRLLEFAAEIIELTESLPNTRVGNHVAGQLLRCGTSPLSNYGEVEAAESRRDFFHKLRICLTELRETKRWLCLVGRSKKLRPPENFTSCLQKVEEPIRIFVASVRTAERNAK